MTFLRQDAWPRVAERVERYEALGIDAVWIADHFVFPWDPAQPWLEGWSLLAGLAARTRRIRLGSMATHVVYRNPAVLARTAMTVDRISGGRLCVGIGAGASAHDWAMTRGREPWPAGERVARFAEAVEIVDGLLRGALDSYEGRYYRVAGAVMAPGPIQQPRPRLVIAANGPRMVKLAARYGDAWVTEGAFHELRGGGETIRDVVRIARERAELLNEEAAALGRDAGTIGRIFLAGFAPGATAPWASPAAWQEIVGRFLDLGFDEFVFPEPQAHEWTVFERVVAEAIPALASPREDVAIPPVAPGPGRA
jgi:alkanesulfonate monooxygenase SsuD/methylene tetrahydromethanopterin reductase-like flavin-dependent oxidoreductase (luciferase family)